MNFAEQLAYWYLRLNGFFPLTNFVLHRGDAGPTSDADLVAVRFPHVSEDIGGRPGDWDSRFQSEWGISLSRGIVALIVEVKSGHWTAASLCGGGRTRHLRDGLRRIGVLPLDKIEHAVDHLTQFSFIASEGITIGKLFVGNGKGKGEFPWLHLQLDDADQFIQARMTAYAARKAPDRLFFSGDLIQYLAWRGGLVPPEVPVPSQ